MRSPALPDWQTQQQRLLCGKEGLSGGQPLWLSECVSVAACHQRSTLSRICFPSALCVHGCRYRVRPELPTDRVWLA